MSRILDLELLQCFQRVAEFRNVTRAAFDLGISQPALTRLIRRLEDEVGTRLLTRAARGVTPTEAGQLLLSKAAPLLAQAHVVGEQLSQWRSALSGDVSLGMPSSLHHAVTLPLVQELRESEPGIRLSVMDGFDAMLHAQLRDGRTDIGVLIHDTERLIEGVDQQPIANDPLMVMAPMNAFPDAGALTIDRLRHLELVLPGVSNSLRQHVDKLFRRRGAIPRIAMEVDSWRLAHDLVTHGNCVTIVPASGVRGRDMDGIGCWPIAGASIFWARCVSRARRDSPVVREVCSRLDRLMHRIERPKSDARSRDRTQSPARP
ncbi:hypothetical protein MesoLjLc_75860 [Mesorhizobium sp. L-8-10]|uniref:LysR family transcriptional regulator n=1 Tax=Mesorhizobium sp. L-8-10 TaxID=2744523 RepID=UPI00192653A5|nr:LysR family transcriptional regulator [Mesorhizobium sp. L-8-10]BCH35656.1 hypothetical protein MesoLjLc_75860 [Mesorhizobium sp. L-8-10]